MYSTKFKITNLTCAACVKLSVMALKSLDGVTDVTVDSASGETQVSASREITWEEIVNALSSVEKKAVQL